MMPDLSGLADDGEEDFADPGVQVVPLGGHDPLLVREPGRRASEVADRRRD